MLLFCRREIESAETRVAVTPDTAGRLIKLGLEVRIERDAGAVAGFDNASYEAAGAKIIENRAAALPEADVVAGVRPPSSEEALRIKADAISLSFLDPFRQGDLVQSFAAAGVRAISLEMIPRTTIAQQMDALSSQASIAGYAAVILAAGKLDKVFPMMMTAAGTLSPARIFIIGVGVAGLQAIATARRLGASVTAFDTRPVVEEQVKSLGAKFLKIDLGKTGQTEGGYAKELTPEQIELQKSGMARICAESDVVITTAQIFGRPAPRLVATEMMRGMRPGSLVLDLAVGTGGNVEGSQPDREVSVWGTRVIGCANLPATLPRHASQAFAGNIANFVAHFHDKETKTLNLPDEDELVRGCLLTRGGKIIHPALNPGAF